MEELSLPYERIDVGGPFGRTKEPFYVAMNPNSVVPTLQEPNGFTLWESNAILRYLASVHADGKPIWPADPQARANIDRWMDWQQTILGPPQTVVFQGLIRTAPESRDNKAIEQALVRVGEIYALLDQQLSQHAYLAGPDFTLADIPCGIQVHRWFSFDLERPTLPHLRAWYDRLLERPAYRTYCATPLT